MSVGFGADDVFAVGVVVEGPCWDMGELDQSNHLSMAEAMEARLSRRSKLLTCRNLKPD